MQQDHPSSLPDAAKPAGGEHIVTRNRTEGYIIECDGDRAIIAAIAGPSVTASEDYWAVGQLISVRVGENRLVGLIHKVDMPDIAWQKDADNVIHIHIELVGEARSTPEGKSAFSSGISQYPHMGAIAHRIRAADLAAIYAASERKTVAIGSLTQDASIPALVSIDDLLSRHFAVVGTTGVGKSSAVTLLLRKVVAERPDVRVLILDPHNEFATAFPDHAIVMDAANLDLPFWMFRLEEFADVLFRGREPNAGEMDALRDMIQLARERCRTGETQQGSALLRRRERDHRAITADTPVPYRIADLLALIDERAGQLDGKAERPHLKALKTRLESIINDPRFRFMFAASTIADTMRQTIARIFRVPQDGRPVCVFQLSGLPSEVVNAVASVLCRLAFDLATSSDGKIQTLVVCEEAHRYIPADPDAGFWPTRQAIARIAKEGRKYGVYLGVITQRPGELDPTILSQCNTVFAMRLGNERDQQIIRGAISGAARSMTNFLASIANREAIAFGEALSTPMRMTFETIPPGKLPGAHMQEQQQLMRMGDRRISLESVIERLRHFDNAASDTPETFGYQPAVEPTEEQRPSIPPILPLDPGQRAPVPEAESDWRMRHAETREDHLRMLDKQQPRANDLVRSFRNDRS
ncbi:ATPase [Paramesorhizobium deserti]|uniref:ATPase n=1 Tax=Paramesorhizobium deserti TaxID=1494590 RepID=A0A135HUL1_9HYPH|nr:ATP-binding protein [Paramesorhizobium deserti]KXF76864.1 ATPase [Paramesorhizobium deserti]